MSGIEDLIQSYIDLATRYDDGYSIDVIEAARAEARATAPTGIDRTAVEGVARSLDGFCDACEGSLVVTERWDDYDGPSSRTVGCLDSIHAAARRVRSLDSLPAPSLPSAEALAAALHEGVVDCRYTEADEYNACEGPKYPGHIVNARDILAALAKSLPSEEALAALDEMRDFARHSDSCAFRPAYPAHLTQFRCNCGFDEALERLAALRAQHPEANHDAD